MFSRRTAWEFHADALAAAAARRRTSGGLLDLTETNPTLCGFNYPQSALRTALAQPDIFLYQPEPQGLPAAREAVANYYAARRPTAASERPLSLAGTARSEAIWLTAGSSESYAHLLRLLCDPGDCVHVPRPGYPLLDMLAGLQDVELASYPLSPGSNWKINLTELEAGLIPRSRAVVVIHPNNPTGSYLGRREWLELQALAARHELAVIVDEVFYDYVLEWQPETATNSDPLPEPAALTFVLNGISKISALPQMKLGWFVLCGPPALTQAAAQRLEPMLDSFLTVDTPVQLAAGELLRARLVVQPQLQARLRANLAMLDQALDPCPALRRWPIAGGWQAIVRLPEIFSDEEWARKLLAETGVYLHPGYFYGLDQMQSAAGERLRTACLVLSLLPPAQDFTRAISAVIQYIRSQLQ